MKRLIKNSDGKFILDSTNKVLGLTDSWLGLLPNPTSIEPINITWKDGYRINGSAGETASSSCSISNEYIDISNWTNRDFILFIGTNDKWFGENNYGVISVWYNANGTYFGSMVQGTTLKPFFLMRLSLTPAKVRFQTSTAYKPTAIYKVSF